ncbi:hypothetical protein Tco_0700456 [Tanacetum coccineum]
MISLEWIIDKIVNTRKEDKLDDEEKNVKEGDADDEGDDHINENEEMLNAKAEDSRKCDEEVTNAAKADAKKTEEAKDDSKKVELPLTSSNLSISLGFGDQFLKLSSYSSLVSTVKDTIDAEINSYGNNILSLKFTHIQSPSCLRLRFLDFFNDPRIIREQRIAAYKGYRGGGSVHGHVEGLVGDVWELWCELYELGL